jgi:hypothetical protein
MSQLQLPPRPKTAAVLDDRSLPAPHGLSKRRRTEPALLGAKDRSQSADLSSFVRPAASTPRPSGAGGHEGLPWLSRIPHGWPPLPATAPMPLLPVDDPRLERDLEAQSSPIMISNLHHIQQEVSNLDAQLMSRLLLEVFTPLQDFHTLQIRAGWPTLLVLTSSTGSTTKAWLMQNFCRFDKADCLSLK